MKKRPVCNDRYAVRFMDKKGRDIFEPFLSEKMPNISNITRCRLIDDYLKLELDKKNDLNIITIGAGFDSRPYRLAGGIWVEIDEPQIINSKNEKLPLGECPNPLTRITIDFANETLASKLEKVDRIHPTIFVIEGVFMYLGAEAIESTISTIQKMFPKHVLYCDLMSKNFFEKFAEKIHSKLVAAGGEFTTLPKNPEAIFIQTGYELAERIAMFERAGELGLLWDEARIPKFVSRLLLNVFFKDLGGYAVHRLLFNNISRDPPGRYGKAAPLMAGAN